MVAREQPGEDGGAVGQADLSGSGGAGDGRRIKIQCGEIEPFRRRETDRGQPQVDQFDRLFGLIAVGDAVSFVESGGQGFAAAGGERQIR